MKALIVAALLIVAQQAYALDGFVSIEEDAGQGVYAPDLQAQIGQKLSDDYRVYIGAELTKQVDLFPNSPRNYVAGAEFNHLSNQGLKFEVMGKRYLDNSFLGVKATYSFDLGSKGR
jgi:hypothetical protein